MVVAPEHPLLDYLVVPEKKNEVEAYVQAAAKKVTLTVPIWLRINQAFSPAVTV